MASGAQAVLADKQMEIGMSILEFLTIIAGITGTASFFLQTFKIIKRKSAGDVSSAMYFVILPGAIIWLVYGINIRSLPIIITEVIMIVGVSSILICSYIYRDEKKTG